MYKLLLCGRYLRTRYIALASIVSVTLGVATMIVVNSVMGGFRAEMHRRLHDILSDIVVESHSLEGIEDPEFVQAEVRRIVGADLAGMTSSVHIPAMLSFQVQQQWVTRQVNLIGVDEETYARVSDFGKYLLHPENRGQLNFLLREGGYDARLQEAGWTHRRRRVAYQRAYRQQQEQARQSFEAAQTSFGEEPARPAPPGPGPPAEMTPPPAVRPASPAAEPTRFQPARDPFAAATGGAEPVFDEMTQQHTGIILGIAIASVRQHTADGGVADFFLCRPGDDVKATFPTAGTPPQAVSDAFTVVDLYESKMSEYDSSFAFVPLRKLQQLRGMIDPRTGMASVTAIQIKLRDGANLDAVRDRLRERFPPYEYRYRIETWRELQGPLLAAVQMETTILNILLFLIIAVAGFGILATFFMIVVEKTRDIGILKSLGAPSGGILSIFLGYGLSLGAVGSGVGLILGLLFVTHINQIADLLELVTGQEVFDPTIYYFSEIPTVIHLPTLGWIVGGALLIAVLASVLPALRAARLHPVEALRYE